MCLTRHHKQACYINLDDVPEVFTAYKVVIARRAQFWPMIWTTERPFEEVNRTPEEPGYFCFLLAEDALAIQRQIGFITAVLMVTVHKADIMLIGWDTLRDGSPVVTLSRLDLNMKDLGNNVFRDLRTDRSALPLPECLARELMGRVIDNREALRQEWKTTAKLAGFIREPEPPRPLLEQCQEHRKSTTGH